MEKQIVLTRESYDAKVKELEQLKPTGRDAVSDKQLTLPTTYKV